MIIYGKTCGFGITHWWARYKTNDHVNLRADGKLGICTDHSHVSLNSLPHMHTLSLSHPAISCAFDYCRKKMQTYLFSPVAWLGSSHISRTHSLNKMIKIPIISLKQTYTFLYHTKTRPLLNLVAELYPRICDISHRCVPELNTPTTPISSGCRQRLWWS